MRLRRTMPALLAGVALTTATAAVPTVDGLAATRTGAPQVALAACTAPAWAEGASYPAGSRVSYAGRSYQARVTHTPPPGAGWNPAAAPALWTDLGACDGGGTPSPTPPALRGPPPPPPRRRRRP